MALAVSSVVATMATLAGALAHRVLGLGKRHLLPYNGATIEPSARKANTMEDLNIVIGGAAGEGIQTIGEVLAEAISALGYAVFTWQENESRIRGGLNRYSVRVSEKVVNAPMVEADILLTLSQRAVDKYGHLLKPDGILIAPVQRDERTIAMSLKDIAEQELGNAVYANTIAVGALAAALGMDLSVLQRVLARQFAASLWPLCAGRIRKA
jgi:2-oxoglutarate ferredoxin oxidoreductase subunit alpha